MKRSIFVLLAMILIASGAAVAQTAQTQDEPSTMGTGSDGASTSSGARTATRPGTNNNLNNQVESHSTTGTYVGKPATTTTGTATSSETMVNEDSGTMEPAESTTPTTGMATTDTMDTTTETGVDTGDTLPATGSELPLVGATGLLALLVAAGLRLRRA